ncbi:HNH endonuclease [Amycolatopsis sp. NBC_00348]|uniref:HNH endonuclease signature motif containing protein n=1 Tax=Amycolatopsis sp. NBC_00348 TaxID=2975956 RepID=UPI002E253C82
MDDDRMWQADAVALADRVDELVTRIRCAEAELGAVLVEIEHRGVDELFGYRSVARFLADRADISAGVAGKLMRRARELNADPALAPATAAAAREGRLSNPAINTILETVRQIPDEHRADAERELVTLARTTGRRQVAVLGTHLLGHFAPVDTSPPTPERQLSLRRKRTGVWELHGRFDDETGTRAHAMLDSLTECRSDDPRSPRERFGDAFSDVIDLALNSLELPRQPGRRAPTRVTVSIAGRKTATGSTCLDDAGEIPAADALIHACDGSTISAVLDGESESQDLGRLRRLMTAGLRRALHLRGRGCAFDGCHRPPRQCQGHHIRQQSEDGLASWESPVQLCSYHHRLLHRSGWQIHITPDGLAESTPPTSDDRRRKPEHNDVDSPQSRAA